MISPKCLACVAGGMRERASKDREEFASGEAASEIQLDSSPILSRLHHSRSRLRYQNKSTRTRNSASYAGYQMSGNTVEKIHIICGVIHC